MYQQTAMEKRIIGAYLDLAATVPHSKMTITALCAQARIARSTFYYYYGSVREVLDSIEDRFFAEYSQLITANRMLGRILDSGDLSVIQRFLLKNRRLLTTIFIDNPDQRFETLWVQRIQEHFREYLSGSRIRMDILSAALLSIYRYWLTSGRDLTSPEVENANRWLPEIIRKKVF